MEIPNRCLTSWVLYLEECEGKKNSFKGGISYDPSNKAGVIAGFTLKIGLFQEDFHDEKNMLWKTQIDASHLGCFILKNVNGKRILLRMELATTPQTRQG
jgi:hypothetical protein